MDFLFLSSIVASFLAGMVALFAPCCITVLLPAYLASALREKKRILKMTLVFFAGIALVLVPIGLGAAWLAEIFRGYHNEMYFLGGAFMVALAAMSFLGKGFSILPMGSFSSAEKLGHARSVFALGVFSGAATSCCAPVLAGAMTLAVLSAGFWKSLAVVLAYVSGIVFPLLLSAYFYDYFQVEKSRLVRGKIIEFKIRGKTVFAHTTNILAGTVFLLMGIALLYLAFSGDAFWAPVWQARMGDALNDWSQKLLQALNLF